MPVEFSLEGVESTEAWGSAEVSAAPAGPTFPTSKVRRLLMTILGVVKRPDFQAELECIEESTEFVEMRQATICSLFTHKCMDALVAFGFKKSQAGLQDISNVIFAHRADSTVATMAKEIEDFCRVPQGSWFRSGGEDDLKVVCVKHAEDEAEVSVKVKAGASMLEVKKALAKQLGRPDIVEAGCLVNPCGDGTYAPYRDDELVGECARLLFRGTDLAAGAAVLAAAQNGEIGRLLSLREEERGLDEARTLTKRQAWEFLQSILELIRDSGFQKSLDLLYSKHRSGVEMRAGVDVLFMQVCRKKLAEAGFGSDCESFDDMLKAVSSHGKDNTVRRLTMEIEQGLRLNRGEIFSIAEDPKTRQLPVQSSLQTKDDGVKSTTDALSQEVRVRIKHATTEEEVVVTVSRSATMHEVKVALSRKLKSKKVLVRGRLVELKGSGAYTPYERDEPLGKHRTLFFTGADLTLPEGVKAEEPCNGEELEEDAEAPASLSVKVKMLSLPQVNKLLASIYEICQRGSVQEEVEAVRGQDLREADYKARACMLCARSCKGVLVDAGFSFDEKGLDDMCAAVRAQKADTGVRVLATAIEELLKLPRGSWFEITDYDGKPPIPTAAQLMAREPPAAEGAGETDSSSAALQGAQSAVRRIRDACSLPGFRQQATDPTLAAPLFIQTCAILAAEFGFGKDDASLRRMLSAVGRFAEDPVIRASLDEVEQVMGVDAGTILALADSTTAFSSPEVTAPAMAWGEEGAAKAAEVSTLPTDGAKEAQPCTDGPAGIGEPEQAAKAEESQPSCTEHLTGFLPWLEQNPEWFESKEGQFLCEKLTAPRPDQDEHFDKFKQLVQWEQTSRRGEEKLTPDEIWYKAASLTQGHAPSSSKEPKRIETEAERQEREEANRNAREHEDSKLIEHIAAQAQEYNQRRSSEGLSTACAGIAPSTTARKLGAEIRRQQQRRGPAPAVAPAPAEANLLPTFQVQEAATQPAEGEVEAPEVVVPVSETSPAEATKETPFSEKMSAMMAELARFRAAEEKATRAPSEQAPAEAADEEGWTEQMEINAYPCGP